MVRMTESSRWRFSQRWFSWFFLIHPREQNGLHSKKKEKTHSSQNGESEVVAQDKHSNVGKHANQAGAALVARPILFHFVVPACMREKIGLGYEGAEVADVHHGVSKIRHVCVGVPAGCAARRVDFMIVHEHAEHARVEQAGDGPHVLLKRLPHDLAVECDACKDSLLFIGGAAAFSCIVI
eukprot:CAMPEP_0177679644 /NCGR_PEP_ID=MMETSP0447-20121125/29716_1 /TAXON_ID=0 /ORGANISM="Stygamoeba regulata, Strain BSH-02190019" /LENGTH=180 /DNA_ID=CAMNT_0019188855 /DNA_START=68 /DNA_END=610 /DNA_ORIENTATION=-